MSYPDPPPPHSGGNQEQSELNSQSDKVAPFKRQRNSETIQLNPRDDLPNNPGKGTSYAHIFYKTRPCGRFLDGKCSSGELCNFAHSGEELREVPPNWHDLVREAERGAGSWNDDQRTMQRAQICMRFYRGEECSYGESCSFIHERPPNFRRDRVQRESDAIRIGTTSSNMPRRSGSDMSFWKTRLCGKYESTGHCPSGERCQYAHRQSELQAYSGRSGAEEATNFPRVPTRPPPIAASSSFPGRGGQEDKNFRLWNSTKKLSGIYADWIDEENPPHRPPGKDDR